MATKLRVSDRVPERVPNFEETVAAPKLSPKRQALADALSYNRWDHRMSQLPAGVRLQLKEMHEALHDCGFTTLHYYRERDGKLTYVNQRLERDDHEHLKLDEYATLRYSPDDWDLDRSHSLTVRVRPNGNVLWWHSATPKGQRYGRHEKLGNGRGAGSLLLHFKGVAPRGQMDKGRAEW